MIGIYTTYVQPVLTNAVSEIIISMIVSISTIILENKFGITKWLVRKVHWIFNSDVKVIINVVYSSNLPFDNFKEYVRTAFRNRYNNKLRVYDDTTQKLDIMVDDTFHIYALAGANNEVSIQTSKIASKMQNIKDDAHNVLDTLNEAKEKIEEINSSAITFNEKEFSLYLDLPYKDPFTKINPPKNVKIKDYELELIPYRGSIIKIKADFVNINTKYRHDLEKVIDHFV